VRRSRSCALLSMLAATVVSGCSSSLGKPTPSSVTLAPGAISNFEQLYSANCAGCHGQDGRGGAAIALANPVYLAIADDNVIRKVTANGVPRTAMPAFAQSAGGMLTDEQIEIIVKGVRSRWGSAEPGNLPSYAPRSAGDAGRGQVTYATFCAGCHGPEGRGGQKGSSIVDPSFLALVSDQGLRSVVIAGRPELGAPDFRADLPGRAMTEQDVTDVVAWVASHRTGDLANPTAPGAKGKQ
jgi:cytochrome c oxidase cbb3-type subunit 3